MITGFRDISNSLDTKVVPATVEPIGQYRNAVDVSAATGGYLVASDIVEGGSTNSVINATGHAARIGDYVLFTGLGAGIIGDGGFVIGVTANSIVLAQKLSVVPTAPDTFDIIRFVPLRMSSTGNLIVSTTVAGVTDGSPLVASVGVANGNVFSFLGSVRQIFFKNTSANTISLGFNSVAVLGSGVTLGRGEVYIHELPFSGALNAIASAAASSLAYNIWS